MVRGRAKFLLKGVIVSEGFILKRIRDNSAADLQESEEADRSRALRDIASLIRRFGISVSEIDSLFANDVFREAAKPTYKLYDPIFGD